MRGWRCATRSWRSTAARSSRRSPASSASCRSRPATTSPPTRRSPRSTTAPRIIVDFWVPERFAGAMKVGGALTATPIARPERGLRRHGQRRRQPARRARAARCGCRPRSRNAGRHAARRHVVPGLDASFPATPIRRSIRSPSSGARTARSSGRSATAGPSARRFASSSATPRACWSTADLAERRRGGHGGRPRGARRRANF